MTKAKLLAACLSVLKAGGVIHLANGRLVMEVSKHFLYIRARSEPCIWHKHIYKANFAGMKKAFTNITTGQISGKDPFTIDPFRDAKEYKALLRCFRKRPKS